MTSKSTNARTQNVAYANIELEQCESTGRPGTPTRFFAQSWKINFQDDIVNTSDKMETFGIDLKETVANIEGELRDNNRKMQIVHQHTNGLCIVTAGDWIQSLALENGGVKNVLFVFEANGEQSIGSKRKITNKNQRNISVQLDGRVLPRDALCQVYFRSGSCVALKACVAGTVLEVNQNLVRDPTLLISDPLLDGYIAVISPYVSSFPPKVKG